MVRLQETLHLVSELASNALLHDRLVGPAAAVVGRGLSELVAAVEHAGRPASPAEVDVRVLVDGIELLAKHGQAAGIVGATSLSEDSLALVGTEPGTKGVEGVDVVGGAGGVGAGAVGVEVLVDVEDEVGGAAVEVGDLGESGARAVIDECAGVGPLVAREEELVGGSTGLADGGDGCLDGGGPLADVDVVLVEKSVWWIKMGRLKLVMTYRLVHDAESDLIVALVLGGNLRPEAGKFGVAGTALADNGAVPAGIVVNVDNAHGSTGSQAVLDLGVEDAPVLGVESAADGVDEVLPADRNTEGVESVIVDEVLHLVKTGLAGDLVGVGACAVSAAAEVKTGDVDTSVLDA